MNYKVEFVSYSGEWPSLCIGILVLKLNNREIVFPENCLNSGGYCYFDSNEDSHIKKGEWDILEWPKDWPENSKQKALEVVNDNIEHGCCGGCL